MGVRTASATHPPKLVINARASALSVLSTGAPARYNPQAAAAYRAPHAIQHLPGDTLQRLARRQILHPRFRRVLLHRRNPVLHPMLGGILLTVADDFSIGRLQDKVRLAVGGFPRLKAVRISGVFANRLDAVQGTLFCLVAFARQNNLAISGFEVEHKLAVGGFLEFKSGSHRYLAGCDFFVSQQKQGPGVAPGPRLIKYLIAASCMAGLKHTTAA